MLSQVIWNGCPANDKLIVCAPVHGNVCRPTHDEVLHSAWKPKRIIDAILQPPGFSELHLDLH